MLPLFWTTSNRLERESQPVREDIAMNENDLLAGYQGETDVSATTAAKGEQPSNTDEICGDGCGGACDCGHVS